MCQYKRESGLVLAPVFDSVLVGTQCFPLVRLKRSRPGFSASKHNARFYFETKRKQTQLERMRSLEAASDQRDSKQESVDLEKLLQSQWNGPAQSNPPQALILPDL